MNPDPLDTLLTLMQDVESGDPLDFGPLTINEEEARRLVALSMLKLQTELDGQGITCQADREMTLLAAAAHLVLENFLLHFQHLKDSGAAGQKTMQELLERLRASGGQ